MPITHNPSSGVRLYHYSNRAINENRAAALTNKDKPMTRHQKRKLERKLKNKGVTIDKENNCLYVDIY